VHSLPCHPPGFPSLVLSASLQIKWEELQGALDRFSAFFTCPRFDNASTEREMKAVDSEHTNNLQDDVRKEEGAEEGTMAPGHPVHGWKGLIPPFSFLRLDLPLNPASLLPLCLLPFPPSLLRGGVFSSCRSPPPTPSTLFTSSDQGT
jgi:hypothetical protein